ncbi:MAG: substrate-binding domain-containing protein [Dethiobacteria bacterium]
MFDKNKIFQVFGLLAALVLVTALLAIGCAPKEEEPGGEITLATTTSTYDSGLLDYLNPIFKEKTGIEVKVVSMGTGQAIEHGKNGDADVLLVHDRKAELELVEEGYFVDRVDVMYNDFIIVGPEADPCGVKEAGSALEALQKTCQPEMTEFISRGDDSGTHRLELRLWEAAEVAPEGQDWYVSAGSGMGDTLRMAHEKEAYCMTDRGTYVSLKKDLELVIVFEGDPALFNQYGVMAVNPERHEHVKYDLAKKYIDFLTSDEGQELIAGFTKEGETLFFPGFGLEE